MIREARRTARTSHPCCSCQGSIEPGEKYRVQVTSPGHEGIAPDHWASWFRCIRCLVAFGQEPSPTDREVRPAETEGEAVNAAAPPPSATLPAARGIPSAPRGHLHHGDDR